MTIHRKAQLLDKAASAAPNGDKLSTKAFFRPPPPDDRSPAARPIAHDTRPVAEGEGEDESSDEAEVRATMLGAAAAAAAAPASTAAAGVAAGADKPVSTLSAPSPVSQMSRKRKAPDEDVAEDAELPQGKCDRCKTFKRGARCIVPPGEQKCSKCLAERHACYWNGVKYYGDARVKRARKARAALSPPPTGPTSPGTPSKRISVRVARTVRRGTLRPRGRPPKVSITIPAGSGAPASPVTPKRRGRPPKNPAAAGVAPATVTVAAAGPSDPAAPVVVKRGPGRPPKNAGARGTGRPRGRPRRVDVQAAAETAAGGAAGTVAAAGTGTGTGAGASAGTSGGATAAAVPVVGEKNVVVEAIRAERASLAARIRLLRDMDGELERRERALAGGH